MRTSSLCDPGVVRPDHRAKGNHPMPRTALCGLLLALCLVSVGASAPHDHPPSAPPQDVLGWEEARWGMTAADLLRTFGEALQQRPRRAGETTTVVEYVLPQVRLHDASFSVQLQMDAGTHRLTTIVLRLTPTEDRVPSDAAFFSLATVLRQQYGAPTAHHEAFKFESLVRSRTWTFPTTIIELRYARSRLSNALTLTYRPASR
jgi:hypothetical protein